MITLTQYWMGRDRTYAAQLTAAIRVDAEETVHRANLLLARFAQSNPDNRSARGVSSGWRPPEVNAATAGAAKKSNHMLGRAVDLADADGALDAWLMTPPGQTALADIGLWLEHPSSTPRWCHVQTVPPGSGRRVFYP
jgi:hypothetical protein